MTNALSVKSTESISQLKVRDRSTEALTQAIHSQGNEAAAEDRARTVCGLYYDPHQGDKAEKARAYAEFGKVLRNFPAWSVSQAFDIWVRDKSHRPSPNDIAVLAGKRIAAMRREVERREPVVAQKVHKEESRTDGSDICAAAGFTPKRLQMMRAAPMATTFDEAKQPEAKKPHWSETAAPDDKRFAMLKASRAKSALIGGKA